MTRRAFSIGERPRKKMEEKHIPIPPMAICSHLYVKTEMKNENGTLIWRCRCGAVKASM